MSQLTRGKIICIKMSFRVRLDFAAGGVSENGDFTTREWMNGWMDGWMNGWMDGLYLPILTLSNKADFLRGHATRKLQKQKRSCRII